jgi:hypothetical protein
MLYDAACRLLRAHNTIHVGRARAGHCEGGNQVHRRFGHPRAPLPHAPRLVARGALRAPTAASPSLRCSGLTFYYPQEHIDYLSIQALLFQDKKLSLYRQTKLFFSFSKRLSD